jgi:2-dehydropantoate 2-reductase
MGGLHIRSPRGDVDVVDPTTLTAHEITEPYDLVLVACKAYDLPDAMASIERAVGGATSILPLLNGMRHLDVLGERFGPDRVVGGHCRMSATVDDRGYVIHLNDRDLLGLGELGGGVTPRARAIAGEFQAAGFDTSPSTRIVQEMWEKWVFIASVAAITCLLRGSIGDIEAAGGSDLALDVLEEAAEIAAAQGFEPRTDSMAESRALLRRRGWSFAASMLRDIEAGRRCEAEDLLGDLLARSPRRDPRSLLRIAYVHVMTYEARRRRESGGPLWCLDDAEGLPDIAFKPAAQAAG